MFEGRWPRLGVVSAIGVVTAVGWLVPANSLAQSASSTASDNACGAIVSYDRLRGTTTEPIVDCTNPFQADMLDGGAMTYTLGTTTVRAGATVTVPDIPYTDSMSITGGPTSDFSVTRVYHQDGSDWVQVGELRPDAVSPVTLHATGTYSVVHNYSPEPVLQVRQTTNWLTRWLLPQTVHAAETPAPGVYVTTFTVTVAESVPVEKEDTNPSVLFLPGIMGSRLYADDGGCGNDGEYELWFSRDDCEQLRLKTTFTGESKHNVYTKAEESAVIDEIFFRNLYKDFLDTLEDWEENGDIAAYAAVPYDWRLQLEHILKTTRENDTDEISYDPTAEITESYLYQELERLTAAGGGVTIVAHSNGGLLAKQLLHELERRDDPLLNKVSELVLVGVPQTGTPDSVLGILHGSDVGGGWAAKAYVTREIMNTAPFAHHLLPTEQYFELTSNRRVVSISGGEATASLQEKFGTKIDTAADLHNFLSENSGRQSPDKNDLAQPEIVKPYLLQYAKLVGNTQADWNPPAEVEVIQIAGSGVGTPGAVEYFTDSACVDSGILPWRCKKYAPKLSYRIGEVDGDGTVVKKSAAAMSGPGVTEITAVLENVANYEGVGKVHHNFLEMSELHDYLAYRLGFANEPDYEFLLEDVELVQEDYIVFRLHSPVDVVVWDVSGNQVSSTTSEIAGGHYRRYGEVQQVRVPQGEGPFDVSLRGTGYGSFTLEIERQNGYETVEREDFVAVPVATRTQVTLESVGGDNLVDGTLAVDYDDDDTVEVFYQADTLAPLGTTTATTTPDTPDTATETEAETVETTPTVTDSASIGTRVRAPSTSQFGVVAGASTSTASIDPAVYEDLYTVLVTLQDVLSQYEEVYGVTL